MNKQKLMVIADTEPTSEKQSKQRPLWTHSDNSFKFSFLQDCTESLNQASLTSKQVISQIRFNQQEDSAFAFNFQIVPNEAMDTKSLETIFSDKQHCEQFESLQHNSSTSNTKRKKKKKKSESSKAVNANAKNEPIDAVVKKEGGETAELSAEEQLQQQLDWCIEQLELGMMSQKVTSKQKEETSRALKTLRSSKAPLVKKRQVMRAMAGDYRKKMEEEKSKQFKLIQNEMASAQLRTVSKLPKNSSFHRRAEIKKQPSGINCNSCEATPENTFVFAPSNEEFRFNFL